MTKKILIFLSTCALIASQAFSASAAEVVYQQQECGKELDNIVATLTDDGVLTISGNGEMSYWNIFMPIKDLPNYFWDAPANPYNDEQAYNEQVEHLVVEEGVTAICHFMPCKNLKTVELPDSLTTIGCFAFTNCTQLEKLVIPRSVENILDGALGGLEDDVVYVYKDSYAEKYAEEYSKDFKLSYTVIGDLDGDKELTVQDEELMLQLVLTPNLTQKQITTADMDGDEQVTENDLLELQAYLSKNSADELNASANTIIETIITYITGDPDNDDVITIQDAYNTLLYYAKVSAGEKNVAFTAAGDEAAEQAAFTAADVDKDGKITMDDAYLILRYYATESAGGTPSWE